MNARELLAKQSGQPGPTVGGHFLPLSSMLLPWFYNLVLPDTNIFYKIINMLNVPSLFDNLF